MWFGGEVTEKERGTRERERGRERKLMHMKDRKTFRELFYSSQLGQVQIEARNLKLHLGLPDELHLNHHLLLSTCVNRKLDWKWMSQDSTEALLYVMQTYKLNLLHHNVCPTMQITLKLWALFSISFPIWPNAFSGYQVFLKYFLVFPKGCHSELKYPSLMLSAACETITES